MLLNVIGYNVDELKEFVDLLEKHQCLPSELLPLFAGLRKNGFEMEDIRRVSEFLKKMVRLPKEIWEFRDLDELKKIKDNLRKSKSYFEIPFFKSSQSYSEPYPQSYSDKPWELDPVLAEVEN